MSTFHLQQVCDAIGVNRGRVEMWISRGRFAPVHNPETGHAREWSARDAYRLAIYVAIANASREASSFGSFLEYAVDNYAPGAAKRYLTIFAIQQPNQDSGFTWTCDVVAARDLSQHISSSLCAAVVVDLEAVLSPVRKKLAAML